MFHCPFVDHVVVGPSPPPVWGSRDHLHGGSFVPSFVNDSIKQSILPTIQDLLLDNLVQLWPSCHTLLVLSSRGSHAYYFDPPDVVPLLGPVLVRVRCFKTRCSYPEVPCPLARCLQSGLHTYLHTYLHYLPWRPSAPALLSSVPTAHFTQARYQQPCLTHKGQDAALYSRNYRPLTGLASRRTFLINLLHYYTLQPDDDSPFTVHVLYFLVWFRIVWALY